MSIINTALIGKLKKTKADKTNVLQLDQTTSYIPTLDFHPATKSYVDDLIASIDESSEITYDNTASGLTSVTVQGAIDELSSAINGITFDTSGDGSSYLSDDGTYKTIDLSPYVTNTSDQALATTTALELSGTDLILNKGDGTTDTISLAAYLDDTTNTVVSAVIVGTTITFTREDSTTFDLDITSLFDDSNLPFIESGAVSGSTLTLTRNDASTIDIDVSSLLDNVDAQTLSFDGTNLSISNGNSVDLSSLIDDTNLSRITSGAVSGTTLTLTRDDATTIDVDVSSLLDNIDTDTNTYVTSGSVSGNTLTLTLNDASTVDIDVSSLLDDTDTNTYVNSGEVVGSDIILTNNNLSTVTIDASDLISSAGAVNNVFGGRETQDFTATAGQTVFNISVGLNDVEVFYNGIKLDNEDYTVDTVASTITLLEAAEELDNIEVVNFGFGGNIETAYEKFEYTAGTADGSYDGDLSTFPCVYNAYAGTVEVFLNGLKLLSSEYTADTGTSITLTDPAVSGQSVEIVGYIQVNTNTYYSKPQINELLQGFGRGDESTPSANAAQVIDVFDYSVYSSGEYLLTVYASGSVMTTKMMVLFDGTNALTTSYGELGTNLGTFDANVNGSNVEITFTPNVENTTVKFKRNMIDAYSVELTTDMASGVGLVDLLNGYGTIDLK
jgi:hypothetical protein